MLKIVTGTLVQQDYIQFKGTVYVMKAVGTHMLLTFCMRGQTSDTSQLYSLLMSRNHILTRNDVRSVHNLLDRRGLNVVKTRELCANGGAGTLDGQFKIVAWALLTIVLTAKSLSQSHL